MRTLTDTAKTMREPRRENVDLVCMSCSIQYRVPFSRAKKGKRKFCSIACMYKGLGTSLNPVEAFWMKVEKRGPDECWGWKAQKRWDGYGRFRLQTKPIFAHRFSYELHHGPIANGLSVMHTCDRPECTNPRHLRLGTHAQNMADMKAKGRFNHKYTPVEKLLHPEMSRRINGRPKR